MSLDISLTNEVVAYEVNITHNLGVITQATGIYYQLWRPEEIGVTKAGEIIEPLKQGLLLLKSEPDRFREYNADNGWGVYEDFVSFVVEYLRACIENPEATIHVSR